MSIPQQLITQFSKLSEFLSGFTRNAPCFALRVGQDVYVDNIFIYLHVEDILCMRQVNRAFFVLTHEPIIWKRFLPHVQVPLPPIPPAYSYPDMGVEIEQLIVRAVSLDNNWKSPQPYAFHQHLAVTGNTVVDMKLVPGGKHLVASVKDTANSRFFLMVFAMDHPNGARAVARVPTDSGVFDIHARYVPFEGKQGLMISYCYRKFTNEKGHLVFTPFHISDFSIRTELDLPYGVVYECVCVHVALDTLELMSDPLYRQTDEFFEYAKTLGPPFKRATSLKSPSTFNHIDIFELRGGAYIAFSVNPTEIILIDMGRSRTMQLRLLPNNREPVFGQTQKIETFRVLPKQGDILVVRSLNSNVDGSPIHLVELFRIPPVFSGVVDEVRHKEWFVLYGNRFNGYQISDCEIPTLAPDHLKHPPPIALYFRTFEPPGISHMDIPATSTGPLKGTYVLGGGGIQQSRRLLKTDDVINILPGARRAVIYITPKDNRKDTPPINRLLRYISAGNVPGDHPHPDETAQIPITRHGVRKIPKRLYAPLGKDLLIGDINREKGLAAITWDESIGRLCMASAEGNVIDILDYGQILPPNNRLWDKLQVPHTNICLTGL